MKLWSCVSSDLSDGGGEIAGSGSGGLISGTGGVISSTETVGPGFGSCSGDCGFGQSSELG